MTTFHFELSAHSRRINARRLIILLHRAAKKTFNDLGLKKLPTVRNLQEEYAKLLAEKKAAYPDAASSGTELFKGDWGLAFNKQTEPVL